MAKSRMPRGVGVVFRKEVVDNLRDKRSVSSALLVPLLGPALIVAMLVVMGRSSAEKAEKPLDLPIVGAENAKILVDFLEQHDLVLGPGRFGEAVVVATGVRA